MNAILKKILLIAALVPCTTASAQNATCELPAWVKGEKLKNDETVGCGADSASAVIDALAKIYDQTDHTPDSTSLMAHLLAADSTLSIDQRSAWIEKVAKCEAITVRDCFRTLMADTVVTEADSLPQQPQDSIYRVLVANDSEQLARFESEFQSKILDTTKVMLIRARYYHDIGDLIASANEYATALEGLTTMIHRPIRSDSTCADELGQLIFSEYVTLFDSIEVTAQRPELPVVSNEDIPIDLHFRLTSAGRPIRQMPIQVVLSGGRISAPETCDNQGLVAVHIKQAPLDTGIVRIAPHGNLIALTSNVYVRPLLAARQTRRLPSAETRLIPFCPVPTVAIMMDSIDRACHHDSIVAIVHRAGMTDVASADSADLICSIKEIEARSEGQKHGNYTLATTRCSIQVTLTERLTGDTVKHYEISQFDFTHPIQRSEAAVHQRAMELLMREVSANVPKVIVPDCYDKRKAVYSRVQKD